MSYFAIDTHAIYRTVIATSIILPTFQPQHVTTYHASPHYATSLKYHLRSATLPFLPLATQRKSSASPRWPLLLLLIVLSIKALPYRANI
jgi:hypothetical protein